MQWFDKHDSRYNHENKIFHLANNFVTEGRAINRMKYGSFKYHLQIDAQKQLNLKSSEWNRNDFLYEKLHTQRKKRHRKVYKKCISTFQIHGNKKNS